MENIKERLRDIEDRNNRSTILFILKKISGSVFPRINKRNKYEDSGSKPQAK